MDFLYEYMKGRVKGWNPETDSYVFQLPDARANTMKGRPPALVVDIVEDLRAALDYMVFELSVLNRPDLNERTPQFVIADTKEEFDRQSKGRLRYLTEVTKTRFIEKLQLFNRNETLRILRDISGQSKHRRLLTLRDNSGWEIHMEEAKNKEKYSGWFMYPMEKGHAFFARPKSWTIILLEKYDAMGILKMMAEHVADIVRSSHCFFEGRPFEKLFPRQPQMSVDWDLLSPIMRCQLLTWAPLGLKVNMEKRRRFTLAPCAANASTSGCPISPA